MASVRYFHFSKFLRLSSGFPAAQNARILMDMSTIQVLAKLQPLAPVLEVATQVQRAHQVVLEALAPEVSHKYYFHQTVHFARPWCYEISSETGVSLYGRARRIDSMVAALYA